jgi:hypothetical protein
MSRRRCLKGGKKRRSAATARAATAGSARKADTTSGCGAVMGVKESSGNEAMPRRWLRRASGALARRAAGAGAALARGRASVTHDDSAGGNGDVGVEGRHDLGLWRGERGVVEASNEVMRLGVGKARKERARAARGASRYRDRERTSIADAQRQRKRQRRRRHGRPTRSRAVARGVSIAAAEQRGDVTGAAARRAEGALVRRAARAGAEPARWRASSMRCDRAGGNGDVGTEGDVSIVEWPGGPKVVTMVARPCGPKVVRR